MNRVLDLFQQLLFQNERLHGLYLLPNTMRVNKSEIIIWEGYVRSME